MSWRPIDPADPRAPRTMAARRLDVRIRYQLLDHAVCVIRELALHAARFADELEDDVCTLDTDWLNYSARSVDQERVA